MKPLLTLLAAAGLSLAVPQLAAAQYYYIPSAVPAGNPGSLNADDEYPVGGGLPAGWTTVFSGTAASGTTPVWTGVQTLPFAFQFNGAPVTDFKVATSGVLTFNTAATAVPGVANTALPSANIPDNSLCVWGLKVAANDFIVSNTFGTAPHRQFWLQFNSTTEGGNGAFVYWSIVLEEGTNKIYFVDQRTGNSTSLTVGMQFSATSALQVAASPNVDSPDQGDPTPGDNSYYEFIPGTQAANDLQLTSIDLGRYQTMVNPVTIQGMLYNRGSAAVTSYDLSYSINNGAPVTATITGTAVASLADGSYAHPTDWQPAATGQYTIKVWTSNPNGQPDANPADDTLSVTVNVADTAVTRTVVEESFTSSTCPPCRLGNQNVHTVNNANPGKFVRVAYQQNFPAPGNDPYYTAESGARFQYYNGSYIPYMMLDGGWGDNSQSLTTAVLNRFYNVPAIMSIDATYSVSNGNVAASATVTPYYNFPAGQLVAHMVITERHTKNNRRTNGETDFYDVMKKMMPDENGTTLGALTSRQPITLNEAYAFPLNNDVEHFDSLEVKVFVQDIVTKEVFQGVAATRVAGPTGTPKALEAGAFAVVPNPAVGGVAAVRLTLLTATSVSVDVFDALGRRVAGRNAGLLAAGSQEIKLDAQGLTAGVYVVRVTQGGVTRSQRLSVQ